MAFGHPDPDSYRDKFQKSIKFGISLEFEICYLI